MPDQNTPNRQSNTEPAEGSRETVTDTSRQGDNAGGITNRPLDREQEEQGEVPPRGQRKDEATGSGRER